MWNPFEIGELEIVIARWHGAEYVRPGHSDNGHFGSFSEFQLKILNGEYHQIRLYMCFKLLQSIFNCHIAKFHKILRHLWRFQDVRMDYLSLKLNSRDFPRCWFWHHQKSSKIPHGATLPLRQKSHRKLVIAINFTNRNLRTFPQSHPSKIYCLWSASKFTF